MRSLVSWGEVERLVYSDSAVIGARDTHFHALFEYLSLILSREPRYALRSSYSRMRQLITGAGFCRNSWCQARTVSPFAPA